MAILGLFFLSGASALVYEVVWTRDLTNVFGGSAFAVATVLAAFMAGLALGSTVFGRAIDRRGNPLAVYAILEAGIAVWAILLPTLLSLLDRIYAGLYQGLDPGFYTLSLVRFVLCFLLLLVPTTMMGGTLPVLGKLLLRRPEALGLRAGLLYGANTLGAVLGTAAGGFVLLPALGLRGSTWVAVLINLLVAGLALALSRRLSISTARETGKAGEREPESPPESPLNRVVLAVYAASGFAALAYEVAWTKTLSMVLGNTTYAFTAMLTTFLLGLSLGSLLFARLADRYGRPEALLALVQAGIPLLALATIPVMGALPQLFVDGFASYFTDNADRFTGSWFGLELFRILLAGSTMFLPTILMGGTFPLVTRIYVRGGHTGTRLGRLYAANTVGAILGSFLTGFVLVPWLGRQDSILAATFVNLAAAAALIVAVRWRGVPRIMRYALGAVLLLQIPGWIIGLRPWDPRIMASGAYVYAPLIVNKGGSVLNYMKANNLLFYDEATEATVSVWNTDYITSLRTNGKIEASSHGDMVTQKMISHLPLLYHRGEPKRALMIGLASGISVGSLLTHPLERVETVELLPSMAEAAGYFDDYNYHCLEDPRHRLIMNDGRNHLLLTDQRYDIIVSEPSNPWIAGVGSLFTREFFELTKSRLEPGGVVCQWVQTYQFQESDLKTVLATFIDAYPHLHLWQGGPGDLILVASLDPLEMDLDRVAAMLPGRVGEDLEQLELLPLEQVVSLFVTDRRGLETFVGNWPGRVSDDNLYLEYAMPRHMFETSGQVDITSLESLMASPASFVKGGIATPGFLNLASRYRKARSIALAVKLRKRYPRGTNTPEAAARMALEIAPGERSARALYSNALNERAIAQLLDGNYDAAAPVFLEVVDVGIREERAIALNNLGAVAYERGHLDTAGGYWNRAIAEEPNYPVVLANLATLAGQREEYDRAAAYWLRAHELDRDDPEFLNAAAFNMAMGGGDLAEAEALSRRAVALDPSVLHRDTLGFVLVRRERWKEALAVLSGVMEEQPDAMESLLHLGMAQAGLGRPDEARASFRRVIENAGDPELARRADQELRKL